ncbi:hypothetical protein GYMLUDRAFT_49478 [Collybiopsis luxurians FD-317 M1]|uniref:Impact N-terminal domain-containing protein n=1 Tax=Collybiopsis luxurians FD-317 M1 TaxID=944289 RepID=A0A0D0AS96_9AGAR|nr:hypothetical protein GYMLUDRAFT_49478 [Collybiopsis luxurians FD-317 M1]
MEMMLFVYGVRRNPLKMKRFDLRRPLSRSVNFSEFSFTNYHSFPSPYEEIKVRVLISLPLTYPAESPPQLQLLSRYIGAFGVDSTLFGSVLRTYISANGVEWTKDTVCVFDGLQNVLDRCVQWYEERLSTQKAGELLREDSIESTARNPQPTPDAEAETESPDTVLSDKRDANVALPSGIQILEAEPIVDRKSTFVGRACAITDPSQVPIILSYLSSDRHISRAAHPIINAWRCQVGKVLHQDNDDDGETAAGGRLSHLLQILEINNVLVVVTRYFGGIHLGPDRFKHINQAARNALEVGGFLDDDGSKKSNPRGRKH